MKKICAIILSLSLFFIPTGCSFSGVAELNDRMIIKAIGIDYTENGYEITLSSLDSQSAGGGGESDSSSSENINKTMSVKGSTVGEALNNVSMKTGLRPLYSQARILILGRDTAKNRLSEVLDYFLREYTTRSDILLAISDTTAKDIVSASFGKSVISANVIEDAVKSGVYTGKNVSIELYKFVNLVLSDTDAAYCPVLRIADNEFSEDKLAEISGTAVFLGDTIKLELDAEQTMGLLFLTDSIENADFVINTSDGNYTVKIISSKSGIKTDIVNGKALFRINVDIVSDIIEYENTNFMKISASETKKISEQANNIIKKKMNGTLEYSYFSGGCDICRFAKRIWKKDRDMYNNAGADISKLRDAVTCDISVNTKIRRIGKEMISND